jgi:hypothetical protein
MLAANVVGQNFGTLYGPRPEAGGRGRFAPSNIHALGKIVNHCGRQGIPHLASLSNVLRALCLAHHAAGNPLQVSHREMMTIQSIAREEIADERRK